MKVAEKLSGKIVLNIFMQICHRIITSSDNTGDNACAAHFVRFAATKKLDTVDAGI